jgi:GNAT superfamily N-acetyltransferase
MTTLLKEDLLGPIHLMETVLGAAGVLAAEYPLVFQRGFEGRVVDMGDETDSQSACAVLPRQLVLGERRLPIGLIGCVVTDPLHRRRGLAGAVLGQAESWLTQQGALFSLLWADDPRLYLARGYRPIGVEIDLLIEPAAAAALPVPREWRRAEPEDASALAELYAGHTQRLERTAREMAAMLACPGMQTLVAIEDGRPSAYACLGRGRDLQGVVHEWAGDQIAVLGLIGQLSATCDAERLVIMAPGGKNFLVSALRAAGATAHTGYLGLGKLLDAPGAAALLEQLGGGSVTLESDQRTFAWQGEHGVHRDATATLLDLLFAPRGVSPLLEQAREATGLAAEALPLEPFCWGLDSL